VKTNRKVALDLPRLLAGQVPSQRQGMYDLEC